MVYCLLWKTDLPIVECVAESLTSTHWTPVTYPPQVVTIKNIRRYGQMSPQKQTHPWLRTIANDSEFGFLEVHIWEIFLAESWSVLLIAGHRINPLWGNNIFEPTQGHQKKKKRRKKENIIQIHKKDIYKWIINSEFNEIKRSKVGRLFKSTIGRCEWGQLKLCELHMQFHVPNDFWKSFAVMH